MKTIFTHSFFILRHQGHYICVELESRLSYYKSSSLKFSEIGDFFFVNMVEVVSPVTLAIENKFIG